MTPPTDRPVARVGRAPMAPGRERSGPPERRSLAVRSATVTVMIRAAFAAAKFLKRDFGEVEHLQISEKGNGAFVDTPNARSRRLRVSCRKDPARALVATGIPNIGKRDHGDYHRRLEAVTRQTAGVRRWGAASLDFAFLAAGRYDAFFEYGLAPWDVAAGLLLVREAGGIVSDVAGKPYELGGPSMLASNFGMHEPMIGILGA